MIEEAQVESIINGEILKLLPGIFYIVDNRGIITNLNEKAARLLGFNKEALLHQPFSRYITYEYKRIFEKSLKELIHNKELTPYKIKILRRCQPALYVHVEPKIMFDRANRGSPIIIHLSESYKSNNIEDELLQETKHYHYYQSQCKQFVLILHELNAPLSALFNYINGSINRIEKNACNTKELFTVFQKMRSQLERTSKILLQIKNLDENVTQSFEKLDFNEIMEESISLIRDDITQYKIQLHYKPTFKNFMFKGVRLEIQHVLLNIINNSIEALRDHYISDPKIVIEADQSYNDIEVTFLDNGPGLTEVEAKKIFNLHFTTKSYGMGIGLALSRNIVEKHGGSLQLESYPLPGALFRLILPGI